MTAAGGDGDYAVALMNEWYLRERTALSKDRNLSENPSNKQLRFAWYRRVAELLGYIERTPFPDEIRDAIGGIAGRWPDDE